MQVRHIASGTVAEVADHVRLPEGWEVVQVAPKKATETETAKQEVKPETSEKAEKTGDSAPKRTKTATKTRTRKGGKVASAKNKSGKN